MNLGLSTAGQEDIGRLDIPVHDPLRVGRVQGIGNLYPQLQQLLDQ
jgi:hypothetical protein